MKNWRKLKKNPHNKMMYCKLLRKNLLAKASY